MPTIEGHSVHDRLYQQRHDKVYKLQKRILELQRETDQNPIKIQKHLKVANIGFENEGPNKQGQLVLKSKDDKRKEENTILDFQEKVNVQNMISEIKEKNKKDDKRENQALQLMSRPNLNSKS